MDALAELRVLLWDLPHSSSSDPVIFGGRLTKTGMANYDIYFNSF
jgi:hypothetical protein